MNNPNKRMSRNRSRFFEIGSIKVRPICLETEYSKLVFAPKCDFITLKCEGTKKCRICELFINCTVFGNEFF